MIIITGVSSGIGKAIALDYLQRGEQVVGIGRRADIDHPGFRFLRCDLSDANAVENLQLPDVSQEEQLIFIHNAGILGEVDYIENLNSTNFSSVFQVNLFAGVTIVQQLIKQNLPQKSWLIFISSGAGKYPVSGWSAYCSSKAAVNLFCETLSLELQEQGRSNIQVYAVAPGVVDTEMQENIRKTPRTKFSSVDKFITYKENGELYSPELVVKKLLKLLHSDSLDVLQTLRNY